MISYGLTFVKRRSLWPKTKYVGLHPKTILLWKLSSFTFWVQFGKIFHLVTEIGIVAWRKRVWHSFLHNSRKLKFVCDSVFEKYSSFWKLGFEKKRLGNALLKLFPLTGSIEISLPYDSSMNWSAVKQSLEYLCTFRTMENKALNIHRPNNMSYSHGQRRWSYNNRNNFHTVHVSPFLTMTVCFQWFWIWKSNGYSNKVVRLKWLAQFSIHVRRKFFWS